MICILSQKKINIYNNALHTRNKHPDKVRNVKGVQLSVTSPEETRNRSVVNVTETFLYDNSGEPVINGLFDPRMGVIDHGKIWSLDGLDNKFCPGYFGHIELVLYIIFNLWI